MGRRRVSGQDLLTLTTIDGEMSEVPHRSEGDFTQFIWVVSDALAGVPGLEASGEDRVDLCPMRGGHCNRALTVPFPVKCPTGSLILIVRLAVEH